jgi:hypothetical protein
MDRAERRRSFDFVRGLSAYRKPFAVRKSLATAAASRPSIATSPVVGEHHVRGRERAGDGDQPFPR